MKKRPKLSPEKKDRIAELRERNVSTRRIACMLDLSQGQVSWYCLVAGIESPRTATNIVKWTGRKKYMRGGREVRRFTAKEDARLLELAAESLGYTAIGKELGRKQNSVRGRLATLARRDARQERREGIAA